VDELTWLQNWYRQWCDGDWEHSYGITISTLDNPGWSVDIDLIDTDLESKHFEAVKLERSELDWVHCSLQEGVFKGRGGPLNLKEILQIFHRWAAL